MNDELPHSCGPRDCDDVGDTASAPRWWVILWSVWGLLVAGLVALLDENRWLAIPWVLGGVVIGFFALKVLRPFATPYTEWYRNLGPTDGFMDKVFADMLDENVPTEEFERFVREKMETEEGKHYQWEHLYWMSLGLPPLFGLFHGILFGPIVGAVFALDSELGIAAAEGAAFGLFVGPVFVALVAGIALAGIVRPVPGESPAARMAHRCLLLVSPVLIGPCLWHCIRAIRQRTGRAGYH